VLQDVWLRFVVSTLATWRVAHLLTYEDGPGDVFVRLRAKLGAGFFGRLVDCFQCNSLWVSAAFALAVSRGAAEWVIAWLGLSGGACLLQRIGQEPLIIRRDAEEADDGMLRRKADGLSAPDERPTDAAGDSGGTAGSPLRVVR